jgi:lipoprotein-anchoring transpeptidase ErfK/SrfK
MRDFVVIVFVFALVVGGYFGYKELFGDKVDIPSAEAGMESRNTAPAPKAEPAAETGNTAPAPAVDPIAEALRRVESGMSDDMANDLYTVARAALSGGQDDKSLDYMRRIFTDYPDSPYAHHAAVALAQQKLVEGEKWHARNLLSFAYDRCTNPDTRKKYAERMDELNADLIFGPAGSPDAVIYQVQPGDYLSKLAAKYNCPYRLIMKINNISDPRKVRVGQRLKILCGPNGSPMSMSILIDKSEFRMTVYLNGFYLKEYHVGIGQHDFTPAGEFTVGDRIEKPKWGQYEHGHPKNILGDYWLTLDNSKYPGLGIHGTTEPNSIGTKSSLGCIRMYNEDVSDVYIMVPKRTKVTIRE